MNDVLNHIMSTTLMLHFIEQYMCIQSVPDIAQAVNTQMNAQINVVVAATTFMRHMGNAGTTIYQQILLKQYRSKINCNNYTKAVHQYVYRRQK